jgi:hypothetical protein
MADQYLGGLRVTADGALYVSGGYNPASVAITGGTIDGVNIGATTRGSGAFTTLTSNTGYISSTGSGFYTNNNSGLYTLGTSQDIVLARDAAAALGQRNSVNSQTYNLYDTYTSATDYHRLALKTARATLASVSGASVTATGLIPDGAVLVGLTSKVTVALGTGSGTTGYTIGDGSDVDRWGAIVGTTAGTSSDNTNWTATTIQAFTSAQDVIVTASGGNFNGTGTIYLAALYLIGQCD